MVVTLGKISSLVLYMAVYLFSALFLYFAACTSKKSNKLIFGATAVLLPCILAGFRYGVGVDYFNYNHMYQMYADLSFSEYLNSSARAEFAVYIMSKIASLFNSSRLFFALFAFVIYAPVAKMIIQREDKKDTFFLALFFLMSSFSTGLNIMRQVAAASILLYSMKYVFDRKLKKFVLMVIIASMFHISAIIILPLYFMWDKEEKFNLFKIKPWVIIVAYCVVALNLPNLLQLLGGRFVEYATGEIQGRNLSILLNCIWMAIYLLFNKQITKNRTQNGLYIFMIVIGTILSFTGIINIFLKRSAIYFNYPDFILLTQLKNIFNLKSRGLFYLLVTGYSMFMFVLTYYILGQTGIFPYAFMT